MNLICIYPETDILKFGNGEKELTYGKEYQIILTYQSTEGRNQQVVIVNDLGRSGDYRLDSFITTEEYRDLQITKIL